MLFNTWSFFLFFVIVYAGYILLRNRFRWQNILLLAGSLFFYAFWDWRFMLLMLLMITVTYAVSLYTATAKRFRKIFFISGLVILLGNLAFFKYFNFFAESTVKILALLNLKADQPTLDIILPIGISFYTFVLTAYLYDVYKQKIVPEKNFFTFALFASYFPQILSGPIVRGKELLTQLNAPRLQSFSAAFSRAVPLILMGFLKKSVIADTLAVYTDQSFTSPAGSGFAVLLLTMYLYTLQIYADFSGYTDMARGVSCMFNIELPLNFRQPYFSSSISEFWHRWHISLSTWLRDYLYIPLGGSRKGKIRTYWNNMLTMLLGGLWHGAGWNFIIWGGLHGIFLAVHKFTLGENKVTETSLQKIRTSPVKTVVKILLTFHCVAFAWIFFRCSSWQSVQAFFAAVFDSGCDLSRLQRGAAYLMFYGFLLLMIDLSCFITGDNENPVPRKFPAWLQGLCYAFIIMLILKFGENDASPFIYFQF